MNQDSVKITILVDNRAEKGLSKEHGFSLWIEAEGKRILFDTGQGPALESNSRALGVDLSKTEFLVLSHGHYDHTGGISQVLGIAENVYVYCHPEILKKRYAIDPDGIPREVGAPPKSLDAVQSLPENRILSIREPLFLSGKIGITGPIPRETAYEDTGGPFYLDPDGKSPDTIEDDLALWIQTRDGLIVCVGCSHAGLINTLHYVRKISRTKMIRAVIGGFHLLNAESRRIEETLVALKILDPAKLVPCHCTGENTMNAILDAFKERTTPGSAGMTFHF